MMKLYTRTYATGLFCLLVFALLSFSMITSAQQETVPRFEETDCNVPLPVNQTATCGFLIVPENRSNPESPLIQIGVVIFESTSDTPAPDPLVYLEGGPGGSTLEYLAEYAFDALGGQFIGERDVIFFDQRGTGISTPSLDCDEVDDLGLELLDENLPLDEENALYLDAYEACYTRLVAQGINLNAYNSAASAADLNDLRQVLGIDAWNLFGISYGTRLALATMRDHPEGIRSAILDSTYPLGINSYEQVTVNADRAFDLLFDTCAANKTCINRFPNLRQVFFDLVDKLNANPAEFVITLPTSGESYDVVMAGDDFIGVIFQTLYASELIGLLPQIIYATDAGNYEIIGILLGFFMESEISDGMNVAVECSEEAPFNDLDAVIAKADALPEYLDTFNYEVYMSLCTQWAILPGDPGDSAPVTSDIPTLVISGEFDPITPPDWGRFTAATLENSFFFEFPGMGHGVLPSSDCTLSIAQQFLADPTTEPDAGCISSMGLIFQSN